MIRLRGLGRNLVGADCDSGYKFVMPICSIGNGLNIIGFDTMGQTPMINYISDELLVAIPNIEDINLIVCPEAKAIPLAQELARRLQIQYFVLRKSKKAYMKEPVSIEVESITTKGKQTLWYDRVEARAKCTYNDRTILLFDDVVSTGSSMRALEKFAEDNKISSLVKATVFLEGDSRDRSDIVSLGKLPLITDQALEGLEGKYLD